jgi:ABC-type nitrate/sulfonate/bicarbonate transport system permease component
MSDANVAETITEDLPPARRAARRDRWLGFASFAAMLGIWFAVTGSGLWPPLVQPAFLPSPVTVTQTFWKLAQGTRGTPLRTIFW